MSEYHPGRCSGRPGGFLDRQSTSFAGPLAIMDKFDPNDPKWAKMNKIQLYCKKAPSFIHFCIKSLSVPQDATGGKSHANLIEVPTIAGSAAAAAAPLDLSPPPSPEPLENGSPADEDDAAGEGEEEEEGGGDGTIPNGGNESAHLLTNLLCTIRCTCRA